MKNISRPSEAPATCSLSLHRSGVFAPAGGAIASGAVQQGLLRCFYVGLLASPYLQSRLLYGARKGKCQCPRQLRFETMVHDVQTGRSQFGRLAAR